MNYKIENIYTLTCIIQYLAKTQRTSFLFHCSPVRKINSRVSGLCRHGIHIIKFKFYKFYKDYETKYIPVTYNPHGQLYLCGRTSEYQKDTHVFV